MATLNALRTELKEQASVLAHEAIADSVLDRCLTRALAQHNTNYSVDSLPPAEEELVVLLAWAGLCYIRASKVVNENNASGSHFAQDRQTPYKKNTDLASRLLSRYSTLCTSLGLSGNKDLVCVSTSLANDAETSGHTPRSESPVPVKVTLTLTEVPGEPTSVDLQWAFDHNYGRHAELMIYVHDAAIFVPTNHSSDTGVPGLANGSKLLFSTQDRDVKVVRISELIRSGVTNYFMAALRTTSGRYVLSNPVVLAPVSVSAQMRVSDKFGVLCTGGNCHVVFDDGAGFTLDVVLSAYQYFVPPPDLVAGQILSWPTSGNMVPLHFSNGGADRLAPFSTITTPQNLSSGPVSLVLTPVT